MNFEKKKHFNQMHGALWILNHFTNTEQLSKMSEPEKNLT